MQPVSRGGGKGLKVPSKPSDPVPPALPTPDPNVLLYLQAASRAFPTVTRFFHRQERELAQRCDESAQRTSRLEAQSNREVAGFKAKRSHLEKEVDELKQKKVDLERAIVEAEKVHFVRELMEQKRQNEEQLSALSVELRNLEADAEEAAAWSDCAVRTLQELAKLDAQVVERRATYDAELAAMNEGHEKDKRRMRDLFVRRLRRARDCMIASWDTVDCESTTDVDVTESAPMTDGGSATARVNESLSRSITLQERNAERRVASIAVLEQEEKKLSAELSREQSITQELLRRNASDERTARTLDAKLRQLQQQLDASRQHRTHRERQRVSALQGTVVMQAGIVDHLSAELDRLVAELSAAKRKRRETAARVTDGGLTAGLTDAMRLIQAIGSAPPIAGYKAPPELREPLLVPAALSLHISNGIVSPHHASSCPSPPWHSVYHSDAVIAVFRQAIVAASSTGPHKSTRIVPTDGAGVVIQVASPPLIKERGEEV